MSDIHVESWGNGPDLMLLHGWGMHSGIWRNIRDQLGAHYRLHQVDLPGHGLSPFSKPGTREHIVEKVASVLPAECILCGWSLGGQLAIELALLEPLRVKKLVLISTTPSFIKRTNWQWGMDAAVLQLFMENLKKNYEVTINRFLTLQVSGEENVTAMLARLRESFYQHNQPNHDALQKGLEILLTNDVREKISKIKQPVLLLHGDKDVITPSAAARWMNQELQYSKLVLFPHCGHAPFLSYPDQFINQLHELRSYFR